MRRNLVLTPLQIATLGVLAEEPRHPYDCYRLLRHRRADRVLRLKAGTLYHALGRLEADGFVEEVGTDREGRRPERTVYRITDAGRAVLRERLTVLLAEPQQEYPAYRLAVSEAHNLPRDEVVTLLRQRAEHLDAACAQMTDTTGELTAMALPEPVWLELTLELRLTRAEAEWTRETADRIARGDLDWTLEITPERRAAQAAALAE